MKSKKFLRVATTAMGLTFAAVALAACGGGDGGGTEGGGNGSGTGSGGYDNNTRPLMLSSELPDGVFNPFFYTAGADGDIVGQTQIGMLSTDASGAIVAGEDEPSAALDYSVVTTGTSSNWTGEDTDEAYANYYTDYYFALKDNITFSDGTPLTIKDVLFNIYMYLDPAYTGSSTMYSVNIKGLKAYRTQTTDSNEQSGFEEEVSFRTDERIGALSTWADEESTTYNDLSETERKDLDQVDALFKEELSSDWNTAQSADLKEYEKYVDQSGNYLITENWQVFLYNYDVITLKLAPNADKTKKWYTIENNFDTAMEKTKEALTDYVFRTKLGGKTGASKTYKDNLMQIITYYATANTFRQYLRGEVLRDILEENGGMTIRTVSGIDTYKASSIPTTGEDKDLGKEYDILHIRINGEDPKAIQNFGFTVAPMHYYSSHADEFSLTPGSEYFGVEYSDSTFMNEVRVIQVPLGAGPYRASSESGTDPKDIKNLSKTAFFHDNYVFFESNDSFFLGAPKIKKLCYRVVNTSFLYQSIKTGEIDYGSPTATQNMMNSLDHEDSSVLSYTITDNLGYGYIGINANYVHELEVRKAIMSAMNTSLCISYYGSDKLASAIYRPMSKVLEDYYPEGTTAYYPYDATGQTSLKFARAAGYDMGSDGLLKNAEGKTLKFTFTIAGDSEDHPAFQTMQQAADLLNSVGFDVTVTRDSLALSKLAAGRLEVWAAAWSSSSDPDMYQVYHKNSSATSILAWGFPYIKTDGSQLEKELLDELAVRIEEGRETTDKEMRKAKYSISTGEKLDEYGDGDPTKLCALDLVMELAVELPTYQRKALYVYRNGLFDDATLALFAQSTAFQSPLSRLWQVGYKA